MEIKNLPFLPADILLPQNCPMELWSVVACDQYTSQPEYWERVEERVGKNPSTLRLVLPESRLKEPGVEMEIMEINNTMTHYLREGVLKEYPQCMIYVERMLSNGKLRRGLIGKLDLAQYDYEPASQVMVRATEGTVLERIPPRVAVRKNAPVELPHVLLLADDPERTLVEPIGAQTGEMELLYDFELMEGGGHIRGWLLTQTQIDQVLAAMEALADPVRFNAKYGTKDLPVMLFAVGDGNHSLATAKECYERRKKLTRPEQWNDLPSQYALVELGNLHDESLEFEPIHRIVTGVEPEGLVEDLLAAYPGAYRGEGEGHVLRYVHKDGAGVVTVPKPDSQLAVGTLQNFLDGWLSTHPECEMDYIHGDEVARELAQNPGEIAFLLPGMGKDELFPTVIHDGVLPRKTFSMGEARDKRFYLEGRRIRR